jgi:hypothetical protein
MLQTKYRDAVEQLREMTSQYTKMEVEMYRINDKLGEALNYNNEIEFAYNEVRQQLEAQATAGKGRKKKR